MDRLKSTPKIYILAILVLGFALLQFSQVVNADAEVTCNIGTHVDCGLQEPYFTILGGDLTNGNGFYNNSSGTCYVSPDNLIGSYNTDASTSSDGGNGSFFGGGDQDAIYTASTSSSFVSDLDSDALIGSSPSSYNYSFESPNNDYTPDPTSLVFANKDIPPAAYDYQYRSLYGGDFGNLPCMPDYYASAMDDAPQNLSTSVAVTNPATPYIVDLSKLTAGGTYYYNEQDNGDKPLIINDTNPIPASTSITLAVNGNVFVESNIMYDYTSPADIPELNVYAYGASSDGPAVSKSYGNIYVQPNVTEMHGFFVAQGNPETSNYFDIGVDLASDKPNLDYNPAPTVGYTGGLFSTCATISADDTTITNTADYYACASPLAIDGSVAAQVYWLERDWGDVNTVYSQANGDTNADNAGEVFRYSPETWLPYVDNVNNCTASISSCLSSTSSYQAEISLPPVL